MAENVGLSSGETASMEMLPKDGSHRRRPKPRVWPTARTSVCCALTCCLVLLPILAGLTAYLLVGQLQAPGEACVSQIPREQELGPSPQKAYVPPTVREKPRAHLTVLKPTPTQSMKNQFQVLHWEHELGLAFTKNRMNYTNRFLVIPEPGDYFVYSQVTFRGTTSNCKIGQKNQLNKPDSIIVIITKLTDSYTEPTQLLMGTKSMCEIGSSWFQPIYLGAMFSLQEGDKLTVNVSDISLVDYTKEDKTFFGAFLL